jgi:hypothetical protein
MKSYDPSFQDRMSSAAEAKKRALDKLRSKPPVDASVLAERQAAARAREERQAEARAARNAAKEEEAAASAAERSAAAKPEKTAPVLTEAERKAARDARYAARKSRK